MCDPVTASVAIFAISSAGALYSYSEQDKAAREQRQAIKEGYSLQTAQLMDRYQQINAQASDEMGERAREQRIEVARLRAIGAESGLAGASQERIEQESSFVASQDMATIESNRLNALQQALSEGKASQLETRSRLSAARGPSGIATGLQIAGAAANAYGGYKTMTRPTSAPRAT